jgi:hypothetical protein
MSKFDEGPYMNGYRARWMLLIVVGLFATSGATCLPWVRSQPQLTPVLPPNPTREQIVEVVNRNNGQIQSFTASQASLSTPGAPTLRANLVFQRLMSFRLHGTYGLTGSELDLGSNDSLFWFWVRRAEPQAVYFCRHDQFATSPARQMAPIQPDWLIEALGVSTFDMNLPLEGPYPASGGRLEIRTIKETPEGTITKRTYVDASQGWVMGQEIYNAQTMLLMGSEISNYQRDVRTGLWMPGTVKISCPSANFSMQLNLGKVEVNVPPANPTEMFTMPALQGVPTVDIGNPGFRPPGYPPAMQAGR